MATPQPGIFAVGTRVHHYLELTVRPEATDDEVVAALAGLRGPDVTTGSANLVVGFGPALWPRLDPSGAPPAFRDAEPIDGPHGHTAPATQHDVWLWLAGTNRDEIVDMARAAVALLAPVATLSLEQDAFTYRDSRDFTGFVDGTENPPIWEARDAAIVVAGEPGEGGAHVLTMRFVHDLAAFHALPEAEQERVIGRTKPDSVEFDDDVKPVDAHINRVVIEDEAGEELEVLRRSVPFGSAAEQGLCFVLFSAETDRVDQMLTRMYGLAPDGVHDRLLDFTQATHHSRWFCPSLEALATLLPADEG